MNCTAIMDNGRECFEFHFQSEHKLNSKTNRDDCKRQYIIAFGKRRKLPTIVRIEQERPCR